MWPDNLEAVNVFIAMGTQWRTGMSGPTGLDYNALPVVFGMCSVAATDQAGIFESLRIMEMAALSVMHAKTK
ncbi:MAG: DUF1799 domain-containing protein [Rhodocyclaceae bacterium]|nr:DUF1799 domain-containing protein [Rhodocyclaceae bacterium]